MSSTETAYFDAILARRAMLLDSQQALEGNATASLETQGELAEFDPLTYIEDYFPEFLAALRFLSKEDQELLLCYYVLRKTQATLALLYSTTQTLCSERIRKALKKLGNFIMLGQPTAESMRVPFLLLKLENLLQQPLSTVVEMYGVTRSFQRVAEVLGLYRPDIRRAMLAASQTLAASPVLHHKALGAYLAGLIDKASPTGTGQNKLKWAKRGNLFFHDPEVLGRFRISVSDPDFCKVFIGSAAFCGAGGDAGDQGNQG